MVKRTTTLYNPRELKEILDIMQENFDITVDPSQRMAIVLLALHNKGYKIIKMDSKNTIDFNN
jgi:hypothetical protein